jgi:putative endonuclease
VEPVRAKDALGRHGEEVAARHLAAAGLVILDRNWRCAAGEIDIVAADGDALVICEVKTRRGHSASCDPG